MKIKQTLLSISAIMLLTLGAIGIFLPIWPTTPFVLAAAGCLAGNPKLKAHVIKIPFFREYFKNQMDGTGLSIRTVIISLVFLWGMLMISAIYIQMVWGVLLLAVVGIAVTVHILWISKPRQK